jgi:uncharacterized membrane protein
MNRSRLDLPDILKGLAVILMIQVHLMEQFASIEIFDSLLGQISLFLGGPPAAPIFMAVMGYFIAKSKLRFQQHIKRGLKLIGLGFLLNIGMNLHLLIRIVAGISHQNPWPFIFGADILFLAGMSIILIAIVRLVFKNKIVPYAILTLLVPLIGQILPVYAGQNEWIKYFQAYFWGDHHWSYFPLFPWLAYPLTGFLFYITDEKYNLTGISAKGQSYVLTIVFLLIVVTFGFGFKISGTLPLYYHHSLIFYFWVLIFLIFWVLISGYFFDPKSKTVVSGYLRWAGKNVTSFYVLQWLIIGNLATLLHRSQSLPELTIWFITILAATSLIVLTWQKMKSRISASRD